MRAHMRTQHSSSHTRPSLAWHTPLSCMAHTPLPCMAHTPLPCTAHTPLPCTAHPPLPCTAHMPLPCTAHTPLPCTAHPPLPCTEGTNLYCANAVFYCILGNHGNSAATKSSPSHSGAKHPSAIGCYGNQLVELWATDLVIISANGRADQTPTTAGAVLLPRAPPPHLREVWLSTISRPKCW